MKRLILAIVAIFMIILGSAMLVNGQEIDIELSEEDDTIDVFETYTFDSYENEIISFWIQSGHSDISITINESVITVSPNNNVYSVNISEYNITSGFVVDVKYSLAKNIDSFEKKLQYDTTELIIKLDEKQIYSGTNLNAQSQIDIALQKQSQTEPTTVETIPNWVYAIIAVLLIMLLAVFFFSKRSGPASASSKIDENKTASKEYLTTKKSLLMETLKEIEKKHRSKKISDETYNKLKGRYKQEAVETMKKLEDTK